MFRAYKYRIYPTKEQEILIQKTFGCVRFMYNRLLADSKEEYNTTGNTKIYTPAKYKEEFQWLKEVDSLALCNARMHVKASYSNFFRKLKQGKTGKKVGFPKFHSKRSGKRVYTTNCINNSIRLEDKKLRLPKLDSTSSQLKEGVDD